ncbi:MAG TPA: hypothetical protein VM074_01190 [Solimonas sp.]|nr:hypothetical protein [Solimonas sp.]
MHRNETPPFLGAIRAAGPDSEAFLQGQLTQDLRRVVDMPGLAGYCSPKGRLLAVMDLRRADDGFVLQMHRGVLEATLKRLRMFVMRSRVTLEPHPPAPFDGDENDWKLAGIVHGVPVVYPETLDHFVPQMVNLDQLGAIGFDKGCYTGQEVVARLHYLGNLKRRMFRMRSEAPAAPGASVFDSAGDAQAAGEVVDCARGPDRFELSVVLQLSHASSSGLRLATMDGPMLLHAVPKKSET